VVRNLQLLTHKPLTYAANVGEGDLADKGQSNPQVKALQQKAKEENCEVVVVSAQVHWITPWSVFMGFPEDP